MSKRTMINAIGIRRVFKLSPRRRRNGKGSKGSCFVPDRDGKLRFVPWVWAREGNQFARETVTLKGGSQRGFPIGNQYDTFLTGQDHAFPATRCPNCGGSREPRFAGHRMNLNPTCMTCVTSPLINCHFAFINL
jgi:hypothetical protein